MKELDLNSKPSRVDRHIGNRLRQARERLGESPQFLARALGLRVVDYLQLEAGNHRLGAERLMKAAELLGVTIAWFFAGLGPNEMSGGGAISSLPPTAIADLGMERLRRTRK